MKTREDLIRRALGKLGIPGVGQAPAAEDVELADQELNPVLSDLSRRGIYNYGSADEFGDEEFLHLATCLAVSIAPDYGKPQDFAARVDAESRLRDLGATNDANDPIPALYY